ncbi:MAG: Rne/Rng family ribonuclease [Elusimicrobia bacterium]|nr:Rne/Rng family ribonuclease [Candidatus Liberimonas magnetica]
MKKEIIVNRSFEETRVAILENDKLIDLFMERKESEKFVGNIYKGRVEAILPGISSAFVNIGFGKNAYLNIHDVVCENRSARIEDKIQKKKEILVQVEKEPISTKGPRITMDVSLPGRYLVLMPFSKDIGISRNIESREERSRLKGIINEIKPENFGLIVRTEAEEASKDELKREVKYLTRLWNSISSRYNSAKTPSLIHKDLGLVFQTLRDYLTEDVEIVLIDSKKEYEEVLDFIKIIAPELIGKIKLYTTKTPVFKAFKIEEEIKKLHSNKVKLPSGGYIIIQEAESLCAIDVNTGSFTGQRSQEETVTITNVEAAKEVARQLRLRNIGGIIVIDFIDMKRAKNKQKVLSELTVSVKGDKAKIKILPITSLGLVEMTRERKRESIFSFLGETCPTCHGVGLVPSRESLFININTELEQLKLGHHHGKVKLKLNPDVAEYFTKRLERVHKVGGKAIEICQSPAISWDDYQIIIE